MSGARHAAVTIVSKNYFALAATLAESYRRHHPGHDFIIALVDRADGLVPASLPCGAEVIEIARFAVPDIGRFIYRYTVMELNTAVKPYVLADLFERRGYETLLYLDPDIWIHRPLDSIYEALSTASIALTPHMRRPFYDDRTPGDVTILQSGTYNLGFLGLRAGETARRLLDWWSAKLYRDCIVDIPNGLFVDQKWMDLVPGFFPDHRIVHDPACNVAYWNLHERRLTHAGGEWQVDGKPLAFFHFSGYLPFSPQRLSKHQDRHALARLPALRALTDAYAAALMANGYAESNAWPYAFATLGNGVRVPMDLVRNIMQWAARVGVPTPSPVAEPDAFCRFLVSRGVVPDNPKAVLLFHFVLKARGDVAAAFPAAYLDPDDPGFRGWLRTSGVSECGIGDLLAFERRDEIVDYVADAFERLRRAERNDVLARSEDLWRDPAAFEELAGWLATRGVKQLRFERAHAERLRRAWPGIERILNIYFLRGDLQARYPALGDRAQASALVHWLRENRYTLDLSQEEISLFWEFAAASSDELELMRFLYQHRGKPPSVAPGIYTIEARQREIGGRLPNARIASFLAGARVVDPADHFDARFAGEPEAVEDFDRLSVEGLDSRSNYEFVKRLQHSVRARSPDEVRVNVAGFMDAPTGMGESARSMRATLGWTPARVREMSLPHPQARRERAGFDPWLFGWPQGGADLSISVANADCAGLVEAFLPASFRGERNVGYWVWESEELPARFQDAERIFDEVWTPSRYSAQAIARTIRRPVRVLRHTLDFSAIDRARAARRRYGLPERGTVFGFAFDPMSALERKNVRGLVRAFRAAFREDDDCWLALKVNGTGAGAFDYERIRAEGEHERILFLEGTLSRDDTFGFIKSLDAYVSLHRAEGFGLSCAEAMALGLPVIATGYSGNLEFMDDGNSLLVPATVIEADRAWGPYPAGTRWGDPDLEAAQRMMRSLLDPQVRAALGRKASASVRARLDPKAVGADAWTLMQPVRETAHAGN
jgi:glycosyltransferase involved in cell wall biosynthesis